MKALIFFIFGILYAGWSFAATDKPAYDGPVFDTHLHYSSSAWRDNSPKQVLELLEKANVKAALVSSTPDEGTAQLLKLAPTRLVPGLRPYRNASEKQRWYEKPELLAYAKTRLGTLNHKVFGEVIVNFPQNLDTPEMAEYLDIAVRDGLILHIHSDAAVIEAIFEKRPAIKILWAHAGFSEPPEVIAPMLDQYPTLWAELSYRADDIMGGIDLEPKWRELLTRHAGRFTVGSDTWEPGRWQNYLYLIAQHREWLGKLPPEVAEKIAFQNAETLLGKPAGE